MDELSSCASRRLALASFIAYAASNADNTRGISHDEDHDDDDEDDDADANGSQQTDDLEFFRLVPPPPPASPPAPDE